MRILKFIFLLLIFTVLSFTSVSAEVYSYSKDNTVIGTVKTHKVNGNESLIEIARNFRLGYNEIVDANPALDPFLPGNNSTVNIPTMWILPDVPSYEGIAINISEMRLYYFFKQKKVSLVRTFPIGIGDEGNDTPVGTFKIIEKIVNPSWHVPESIKKERRPGLPDIVPPGPENPLGTHALRLSLGSYLIHGTNRPWAVGRRVTHGCIRLYPEDIPRLFQMVPKGTKVTIVRQPVKVGIKDNKVYIEVHKDDYGKSTNYFNEAVELLRKKGLLKKVSTEKLYRAVKEKSGIPVDISGPDLNLPQKIFAENFLREGKITSSAVTQRPF
jgi:L,D-transpeptidase ErfK/SrfK